MKKFRNKEFYVVKYMFNNMFNNYVDMSESDFYRVFDSIKSRDWNLFNNVRNEYKKRSITFDDIVWVMWDKDDEEYEGFELNEETFKLINYVQEFYDGWYDFIYD